MKDRIHLALRRAGLAAIQNDDDQLDDYGLTSLTLALLIIEFNNEFDIKIPVLPIDKEQFKSVNTLAIYLKALGAQ